MSERDEANCAWSDYRKEYGVSADEHTRMLEHKAFHAGWDAALSPAEVARIKASAWDEGAEAAWSRSTPEINGSHYHWRSSGEPRNPYRAAAVTGGEQ